jgi:uncharacterized membrane protein YphA (DoxX/SURF4 family)
MAYFNEIALLTIRFLLAIVLIISGALKLLDLKGFFFIVVKYNLVKGKLARFLAYSLPVVEVIVGVMLILKLFLPIISLITLLLIITATAGVLYAYFKNNKLDNCGCYGTKVDVPINAKKIIQNIILILIALYLFLSNFYM